MARRPRGRVLLLAVLALGASATGAAAQARGRSAAPAQAPADFPIPKAEGSPGQVSFSHARHRAVPKCSTCHMQHFKMKRGQSGPITLAAKQEGKFCGACHDGQTRIGGQVVFAIDECDRCHK